MRCGGFRLFEWVPPSEFGETRIVSIRGDPFAPRLNRKGGEIGIRNKVAACIGLPAKRRENLPVTSTWVDFNAIGQSFDSFDKAKCVVQRAGRIKNSRMSDDSKKA